MASLETALSALLAEKKYATARDTLITMNGADIESVFEELPEESLPLLFRLLPKELAAEVFVEMDPEEQELLIKGFSDSELKEVVDELYADDAADLVEEMPANVVKRILKTADPDLRKTINELLKYPEDSAGSIMTTEMVTLRPAMTVAEAIKRIRRTGFDKETVYNCYITDDQRHLIGTITIRTLILAEEDDLISDLMEENVISVGTLADQETAAEMLARYDFTALPVVDQENRLVGIVTVDDAIDVLKEEATEDIERMAAILPSDKPYLRTGVLSIWSNRIPWLLLLMVSATFTSMILSSFENALAAQSALLLFIPMLMDTGGNSGSQASVTIIRSLSLGDVEPRDMGEVIWKEVRVALLCGLTLGLVCFGKVMLIDRLLMHNPEVTVSVALVVCLTMAATILCAKLVGCTLPILAKLVKLDPAVCASPFITTIVDALSLLIYFAVASGLLKLV